MADICLQLDAIINWLMTGSPCLYRFLSHWSVIYRDKVYIIVPQFIENWWDPYRSSPWARTFQGFDTCWYKFVTKVCHLQGPQGFPFWIILYTWNPCCVVVLNDFHFPQFQQLFVVTHSYLWPLYSPFTMNENWWFQTLLSLCVCLVVLVADCTWVSCIWDGLKASINSHQ